MKYIHTYHTYIYNSKLKGLKRGHPVVVSSKGLASNAPHYGVLYNNNNTTTPTTI